ncbi:jg23180, partial [Pararge aegeria aegeria]
MDIKNFKARENKVSFWHSILCLNFEPRLSATRKICEVLEELTEQCKQTSSRTKADQAALYDAYMKSDKVVRDLKQSHLQVKEQSSQ